jgi:hypothetical protein
MELSFKQFLLNEANENYTLFFYKGKKRLSITGKDVEKYLSEDGQSAFRDRRGFFDLLAKYVKNRNQMIDFIDNYFWLDDGDIEADELENMNGKWLGFEPVDSCKPLYCIRVAKKDNITMVVASYVKDYKSELA